MRKKLVFQAVFRQKILKKNRCVSAGPFTYIINSGISNGMFDDGLKRADLIPLYQLVDATNKQEYQLTSCYILNI